MKIKFYLLLMTLFVLLSAGTIYSQDSTAGVIDVNNITTWVQNNGFHPPNIEGSWNGAFPKGTAGAIFTEGIVWGGLVYDGTNPLVRVNGSTYWNGNRAIRRLFRVRSFYDKKYLRDDASNTFLVPFSQVTDSMINTIYRQYQKDWNEWPADKGAPFYDKNKNEKYEPDIDIPGIPGASQTIWINYDDSNSMEAFSSPPVGFEIQETYWAYSDEDKFSNVIFKNAKIIYKGLANSNSYIDSMFIAQFSDPDDGQSLDDFIGCDTSLNLGYVYNSNDSDAVYKSYSLNPPSVGYVILYGPSKRTGNLSDSAIIDLKYKKGYRYFNSKPISIFIEYIPPNEDIDDRYYTFTLMYYNYLRGYQPTPPYPYSTPFPGTNGGYGTYMYPGDPVTGTGWLNGMSENPGDRRMWLITGPISMKLGDTAEVSLALVGGMSIDNLKSISALKFNAKYAIAAFSLFVDQNTSGGEFYYTPPQISNSGLPDHYVLSQNYPNPFNPTTTIQYDLPKDAFVKLVVYDILGREVKTLVNENKIAGSYKVLFDSSKLSSGIYFCRITFTNSDSKLANNNLTKVIKMMVLK